MEISFARFAPRLVLLVAPLQDVKKIAKLLHTSAPEEELKQAVANALNRRFYGKDVPDSIIKVGGHFVPGTHRLASRCPRGVQEHGHSVEA